jgi:kynurenine 3-monooxygenase
MGLEDCFILNEIMSQGNGHWGDTFNTFTNRRIPDAEAIAALSAQNFIEMRDKVSDPVFLLRKKIETHISKKYPDIWTPLYTMISFTRIPYARALIIAERQDKIMSEIMQIKNIEQDWEHIDYFEMLQKSNLMLL